MTDINKEYEKEYYDEYRNRYYNPDDDDAEPGINLNWKRIQKGFHNVAAGDQETAETLSGMQANLETLNTDVETLKTAVDDLNNAVETAEQAAEAAAASEAAAEAAQAAIEEIAESIPEDYTELSNDVDELTDIIKDIEELDEPTNYFVLSQSNESYKSSELSTDYTTDGEVVASFDVTVNPYLCYWLKNLKKNTKYSISFDLSGTFLSEPAVYTFSSDGDGAVQVAKLTKDGNHYHGEFTTGTDVNLLKQPYILRLTFKYNSKNNTLSNFSLMETGESAERYITKNAKPVKATFFGFYKNIQTYSGESILFVMPNEKTMLIDTHVSSNAEYLLKELYNRDALHIDYLMISHYHADHIGGLLSWIDSGYLDNGYVDLDGATVFLPPVFTAEEIAAVTATGDDPTTLVARQTLIIETLTEHGCTIVHPTEGQIVDIGDVKIRFYNCDQTVYMTGGIHVSQNYNDFSLCCEILYCAERININNDLGPIGQAYVAGTLYPADIMTAPHHGWDNGANNLIPAYINNVSPSVVIVTNGKEHLNTDSINPNAHMDQATSPIYSWGEANGVPVYPTNINGQIDMSIFPYKYRFDGKYTRYIRNDKNWSYSDNSEHIENA